MSYQGFTVRLPVAMQGFNGSRNPTTMQPGHLSFTEGLTFDAGIMRKEGGAAKLNTTALGDDDIILAGISWTPIAAVQHEVVFVADGTVLRDAGDGSFATTLRSGLDDVRDPPPLFVPAGGESVGAARKLFLFSAVNQVQVVEGTSAAMAAISDPPADWASGNFPTFGVLHRGRLWGGGNASDPHRIYYSELGDHEDFTGTGAGTLPIYPGEGEGIVGGVSFRGVLILFKYPTGVFVIDTRDPSPANWQVHRVTDSVGAVNQHSIVSIENDVLYLDHGGNFHLLSATSDFGDVRTSDISHLAELGHFMRDSLELSTIRRAAGIWYAVRRQAWFSFCQAGSEDNDIRIFVDFNAPDIGPRFFMSRRDVAVSMWMRPDEDGINRPTAGDNEGFVWLLDQEERNKDGVAYPLHFETAHIDFGFVDPALINKMKNGEFLELTHESVGDWDLVVEVWWDEVHVQTINFNMGIQGAALGTFQLDQDVLAAPSIRESRQRLVGSGRRLRLVVTNDTLNADVALADFYVSFTVGDERIRHG